MDLKAIEVDERWAGSAVSVLHLKCNRWDCWKEKEKIKYDHREWIPHFMAENYLSLFALNRDVLIDVLTSERDIYSIQPWEFIDNHRDCPWFVTVTQDIAFVVSSKGEKEVLPRLCAVCETDVSDQKADLNGLCHFCHLDVVSNDELRE